MSTTPFFILTMMFSSVLCFMMNSWVLIWLMLEINTMSFCSLMKTFSNHKKKMAESSMKYFIIQSISSGLLMFSSMSLKTHPQMILMFIVSSMSLMIKSGAAPFHQWLINMLKKVLWKTSTFLMTWQKLAPIYLMTYQMKKYIMPFVLMSCLVGAMSQMNKKSVMEIMGFSSVFNLSWMMLAVIMNLWLLMMFCLIYWLLVINVMLMIKEMNMKEMNKETSQPNKKWMVLMIMITLGGIPPSAGFVSKWIVFMEMVKYGMVLTTIFILTISSINLYIYLRMVSNLLMKNFEKTPKSPLYPSKLFNYTVVVVNSIPLILLSL